MTETWQDRPWLQSYGPGVPADVDIRPQTLWQQLESTATDYPDNGALDFLGRSTSYRQLRESAERAAGVLYELGVRAGDRVAVALPNCPQHVVAFYAAQRLGAIVVENNPTYSGAQLSEQLADSGTCVAIVWDKVVPDLLNHLDGSGVRTVLSVAMPAALPRGKRLALHLPIPRARRLRAAMTGPVPASVQSWDRLVARAARNPHAFADAEADDVAVLLYTGGTTGVPKAAMLTHHNLLANVAMGRAWVPDLVEGEEVFYAPLPFFHAFGLTLCLTFGVRMAAQVVLFPRFDPDQIVATQRRLPATFFPGVAPMFERVCDRAERSGTDLSSIRIGLSGAMALPAHTAHRWEELTGGLLIEGYGMTETSPITLGNPISELRRPGALGVPFPSTDIRVADPNDLDRDCQIGERGELWVRGPQVFTGYWARPQESARVLTQDGWMRTGDIVVMDSQGFVQLVDRIKEIIITGGFNVYPSQVEDWLRQMPQVDDVAVVGLPSGDMGERVVAAVVLAAGARLDAEAMREWCAEKLSRYAIPRQFVVLPDLPRSQIGKVLRRVVREEILGAGLA